MMLPSQYLFCLRLTSCARTNSSLTLSTSVSDGGCDLSESISAHTLFVNFSTLSGDELNCTWIEYSWRGTRLQPPLTLGLYVPPSCSRRVPVSLIWNSSTSARIANRVSGALRHAPVKSMIVFAFGSTPLCTTFSTIPLGGAPPLSRNVSVRPIDGNDARYFSTNGLSVVESTLPTKTKVKSLASANRFL